MLPERGSWVVGGGVGGGALGCAINNEVRGNYVAGVHGEGRSCIIGVAVGTPLVSQRLNKPQRHRRVNFLLPPAGARCVVR